MAGRNMWIEGIGNEVLYAIGAFFGMFVPMLIMVFQSGRLNQRIHPASQENVEATREEVNHQRAEHSNGNAATQTDETHSEQTGQQPIRENHGQHDCPICLGTAEYAIQTNCGHLFCGLCIITYWRSGHWMGAIRCPVCRQTVTLLLINFTREEHLETSPDKQRVVDSIYQYNRRFSGQPRSIREHLRDLPTLLRHAVSEFFTVGGLVVMFRLRIVVLFLAAFLYFISPLDIIPEAVFGLFGFLDDLFVVLLLAIYVSVIYRNVVRERATAQT